MKRKQKKENILRFSGVSWIYYTLIFFSAFFKSRRRMWKSFWFHFYFLYLFLFSAFEYIKRKPRAKEERNFNKVSFNIHRNGISCAVNKTCCQKFPCQKIREIRLHGTKESFIIKDFYQIEGKINFKTVALESRKEFP